MKNNCPICYKEPATIDPLYGVMGGKKCMSRMKEISKPKIPVEMTSVEIKDDRKKYSTDILQSWRDSNLSKEYVKKYPERVKLMVKEGNVTQSEVNSAKNVWDDLHYYKDE